jgi:hypothetical protein
VNNSITRIPMTFLQFSSSHEASEPLHEREARKKPSRKSIKVLLDPPRENPKKKTEKIPWKISFANKKAKKENLNNKKV